MPIVLLNMKMYAKDLLRKRNRFRSTKKKRNHQLRKRWYSQIFIRLSMAKRLQSWLYVFFVDTSLVRTASRFIWYHAERNGTKQIKTLGLRLLQDCGRISKLATLKGCLHTILRHQLCTTIQEWISALNAGGHSFQIG